MNTPRIDSILAARQIIVMAMDRFPDDALAIAATGGKDSTLLLHLWREAAAAAGRRLPTVLFLDEGDAFPEIPEFVQRLRRDWDLPLVTARNHDLLGDGLAVGQWVETARLGEDNRRELARIGFSGAGFAFDPETLPGSHLAKTAPMNRFLEAHGKAALATGIRRDEHASRQAEEAFSPRSTPPHVRIHPLLPVREREVWDYTLSRGLPFCDLYRAGYRSLGTRSGTVKNADVPAWEQDLENTPERAGRHQGKESAMAQLRALGYM